MKTKKETKTKNKMETILTATEIRVIQNLHLLGYMGKMGSMKIKERRNLLNGLIVRGYLTSSGYVTEKGIEVSRPINTL